MLARLDLFDLLLFLNIAECSSLTKGAARSAISLAAASTRIKNLEEFLGTRLLDRTSQGASLTMAGRALRDHARLVAKQVDLLKLEMRDFERGLRGQVRLFAHTTAFTDILPNALGGFLAAHADVRVEMREALSDDIIRSVTENEADIGVVAGPVQVGRLQARPFGSNRLVVVVPQGHPLEGRDSVSFAETLAWPSISLPQSSALCQYMSRVAQQAGMAFAPRAQVGNFEGMCLMVEAGVGLAIVPISSVDRYKRLIKISSLPLDEPWAVREMRLVTRPEAELPALVSMLTAHLDSYASNSGLRPSRA